MVRKTTRSERDVKAKMTEEANAPWRDEGVLRQKYWEEEKACNQIADELGCHAGTVHTWLQKHDIDTRDVGGNSADADYKQESKMRKWYLDDGMSTWDIAEKCGVSQACICEWLNKHDIEKRKSNRERTPTYYTRPNGYEYVMSAGKGVGIHQLVAIADGADAHKVMGDLTHVVHHKKEIPWLNTPGNVELVTQSDHRNIHGNQYTD